MGIVSSDLKNNSALAAVGSFIVVKSSVDYTLSFDDKSRNNSLLRLVVGAVMCDLGRRIFMNT